jgi:hypothetical protein
VHDAQRVFSNFARANFSLDFSPPPIRKSDKRNC